MQPRLLKSPLQGRENKEEKLEFTLNLISAGWDTQREDQVLCRDEQGQGYSHKDPVPVAQEYLGLSWSSGNVCQHRVN